MDLQKALWGDTPRGAIFAPPGSAGQQPPLRTTIQWGWLKDKLEDVGYIKPEHYERASAASLNGSPASAGEAVTAGPRAAFAAGAAATGAPSSNPIYRGMYAQMLARQHGFQTPVARTEQLPGSVAAVADQAPKAAAPVTETVAAVDAPVAAAAEKVAAKVAGLEQRIVDGFQRLGALPAEQRLPTLAKAIDAAVDDAARLVPAAAEVAAKAAPLADDVAKAAPILDDVVKAAPAIEQVVAKGAPVLDDVVHAAASVVKPAVVEAALPVADDALRNGLKGVMSFSAGIDDTLRLLAKF